ncbi:MAG: phosphoglucosamine mutase [Armatimonadetes bacterium]|nr:phosphoglucosamine mutase [Armatimonadota bacterium]NIM24631.1 phosphoglucosamine mutase [Armatimonadota bacterium]NIO98422.1 phosphoglucosamine mutase [Armatimonadota bacterium]
MKISYSGVRGIVGSSLTPDVARRFGAAFRLLLSGKKPVVVLTRDTRPSGEWLLLEVLAGVCSQPTELVYLGIVPTPTAQVMMHRLKADGGIAITASHNPPEWNGFKFLLGPHAIVADAKQIQRMFELSEDIRAGQIHPDPVSCPMDRNTQAIETHLGEVLAQIDAKAIRRRGFRVALDTACGTGERVAPRLLESLGCEVDMVRVKRDSEPAPQNLAMLAETVRAKGFDLGLAQDEDADRLALVSESGKPIGEEYTLAVVVRHLLKRHGQSRPVVVKNTSTSQMIDDLANAAGAELAEVRVGEINLSRALIEIHNQGRVGFGGEGNGGVIYPPVCYGRDSHIAMALVLEHLALQRETLSQVARRLPRYYMLKRKIRYESEAEAQGLMERTRQVFAEGDIVQPDGLKIRFADRSWLQVRPSNTEPVIRIIVEAPKRARADELMARITALTG